jgi:xanthine/uracil permease
MTQKYRNEEPIVAPDRDRSAESIPELIRDLATDMSTLLGKEIQLAKSEMREAATNVQIAVGAIAGGAVIAMAGLVVLLLSAVLGLSNVLEPWLAALIVGAVALLIGFIMIKGAQKKMSAKALMPERTLDSVKKDTETLTRH